MPLRERIMRKAKDRAVENLHELTASYQKTAAAQNGSALSSPMTTINKSKRANRSSYKPFAEQNNLTE
jgi:hypothetical protein